jgi:hypothetical protein
LPPVSPFRSQARSQFGSIQHTVDGAGHLDTRIYERLAALARGLYGQLLCLLPHPSRNLLQDCDPGRCRQPSTAVTEQPAGVGECRLVGSLADRLKGSDEAAIEGCPDLDVMRKTAAR